MVKRNKDSFDFAGGLKKRQRKRETKSRERWVERGLLLTINIESQFIKLNYGIKMYH